MKVLIVLCVVVALSQAGYAPVPYGGYGAPAPGYGGPAPVGVDFFDASEVAQQNAIAEAQGHAAAQQGAAAAADGTRNIQGPGAPAYAGAPGGYPAPGAYGAPPAHYGGYNHAAPVQLTSQGVPVEPLDVQAARAANAAAHAAALG